MKRSGLIFRKASINAMAAAKSLSNPLPGVTLSGLPVPSSLNWLMPSSRSNFSVTDLNSAKYFGSDRAMPCSSTAYPSARAVARRCLRGGP